MDNMHIYDYSKVCPENALREILAGKLKGKSDINPMWRIKTLTELFGPCGVGWKLRNVKYWTEPGAAGEVAAWCSMEMKIKVDGEWSEGIEGIGGSMLVNTEKGKLVTNDEAFKMAYTDAVSVCCKMLGFAADVYWDADSTKYTNVPDREPEPPEIHLCDRCKVTIAPTKHGGKLYTPDEIAENAQKKYGRKLCWGCMKELSAEMAAVTQSATTATQADDGA